MRAKHLFAAITVVVSIMVYRSADAHFQVLLPSNDIVELGESRSIDLRAIFTHPMTDGPVMEMGTPRRFGMVVAGDSVVDLLSLLHPKTIGGKTTFTASVRLKHPGDYVFFLEPAPYWEAAERKMIIHYTKVVVDFLGAEKGWDTMVGLPVEIEPLVRPYGLWTGNTFRGVVHRHGKPVPCSHIEVEYFNPGQQFKVPKEAYITQVIKTDSHGVFSYTMPRAGWWGFAALFDGEKKMKNPEGQQVDVEQGGLIWVKTVDMK